MRNTNKSLFRSTLCRVQDFDCMVKEVFDPPQGSVDVIVDVLFFLHKPPTNHVHTYDQYFMHLWNSMVVEVWCMYHHTGGRQTTVPARASCNSACH